MGQLKLTELYVMMPVKMSPFDLVESKMNQMQNDGSGRDGTTRAGGDVALTEIDLEKQDNSKVLPQEGGNRVLSGNYDHTTVIAIVVSTGESPVSTSKEEFRSVDSPRKGSLSRTSSSHEQCRRRKKPIDVDANAKAVLQNPIAHVLILGLAQEGPTNVRYATENVSPPESQPIANYWVWRIDPNYRPRDRDRGCFSPLWVAFSILIGGLLLDVLISITLGVSALPVNIIIGVIVVLGLGTALRLALEFCHEWSFRRAVQRADANENHGYHPTL
uniref:Uncharacterized protein n=1 Tax=Salix viminalis TaxID=40686 RepID=A0A6N2N342_SALVM